MRHETPMTRSSANTVCRTTHYVEVKLRRLNVYSVYVVNEFMYVKWNGRGGRCDPYAGHLNFKWPQWSFFFFGECFSFFVDRQRALCAMCTSLYYFTQTQYTGQQSIILLSVSTVSYSSVGIIFFGFAFFCVCRDSKKKKKKNRTPIANIINYFIHICIYKVNIVLWTLFYNV